MLSEMTSLRQRMEAVLREHGYWPSNAMGILTYQGETRRCHDLLDALCATVEKWKTDKELDTVTKFHLGQETKPQPSREALEKIIYEQSDDRFGPVNPRIITIPNPELVQQIMAWARGEPEPTKCKACGQDIRRCYGSMV